MNLLDLLIAVERAELYSDDVDLFVRIERDLSAEELEGFRQWKPFLLGALARCPPDAPPKMPSNTIEISKP